MNFFDRKRDKKEIILYGIYILFVILAFLPIMQTGIQCNDDLQWRLFSAQGTKSLILQFWDAAKAQGRVLSCVQIISLILSAFSNRIAFGIIKAVIITINILLISAILKKLFSYRVACMYAVIMPLLLQIALQYIPPTAFTMFVCFPFSWLFISFLLFVSHLDSPKKWKIALSLVLYFLSLCAYEIFIFFSPIYAIIAFYATKDLKNSFIKIKNHIITGVLYIVCYFLVRYFFPSNYAGNQIAISSVQQVFNIWLNLVKSGIPGIYLNSAKDLYLFDMALGSPVSIDSKVIGTVIDARIIGVIFLAAVLMIYILNQPYKKQVKKKPYLYGMSFVIGFIILLPIANAISASWSTLDTSSDITGTIVSYFISLLIVLGICLIFDFALNCVQGKSRLIITMALTAAICIYGGYVQIVNTAYSSLQIKASDRLAHMESVLKTDTITSQNMEYIYSPDACSPYLMQLTSEQYWMQYSYAYDTPAFCQTFFDQAPCMNMIDDGKQWILGTQCIMQDDKVLSKQIYIFSISNLQGQKILITDQNGVNIEHFCAPPYRDQDYFIEAISFEEYVDINSFAIIK